MLSVVWAWTGFLYWKLKSLFPKDFLAVRTAPPTPWGVWPAAGRCPGWPLVKVQPFGGPPSFLSLLIPPPLEFLPSLSLALHEGLSQQQIKWLLCFSNYHFCQKYVTDHYSHLFLSMPQSPSATGKQGWEKLSPKKYTSSQHLGVQCIQFKLSY